MRLRWLTACMAVLLWTVTYSQAGYFEQARKETSSQSSAKSSQARHFVSHSLKSSKKTAASETGVKLPYTISGYYFIRSKKSGKVLDVSHGSTDDGANVQQWQEWGGLNQLWYIEQQAGSYYYIRSKKSGKVLDVSHASTDDGANIHQWHKLGNPNQLWRLEKQTDDYYYIRSKKSGKVLDVSHGSTDDGANVHQWHVTGADNQLWSVEPSSPIIETGHGLQGIYWYEYKMVAHDQGSKMGADLGIFRPQNTPKGWYLLGDVVAGYGKGKGYATPPYPILLVRDVSGKQDLLKKPLRYVPLYIIWGGNNMHHEIVISKPIAPPGYTSLGLTANECPIVKKTVKVIPPENYRCVKNTLLATQKERISTAKIWEKTRSDCKHMGSSPDTFSLHMAGPDKKFRQYKDSLNHPTQVAPGDKNCKGSTMTPGDVLRQEEYLMSADGNFFLMLQNDGNLVEYTHYQGTEDYVVWASNTGGKAKACFCIMQNDGNLVLYEGHPNHAHNKALWATGTNPGRNRAVLQNDGNFVLYPKKGGAVWASGNTVFDLSYSNVLKNPDHLYTEILTDRPEVAAKKVRYDASVAAIQKYQKTYQEAVQKAVKKNRHLKDPTNIESIKGRHTPKAYDTKGENLNSSRPGSERHEKVAFHLPSSLKHLLDSFGLGHIKFSNESLHRGKIKNEKTGYDEDYVIGKVTVSDIRFPSVLREHSKTGPLNLHTVIDTHHTYSGELVLMARNYHGKGTAYASVLITDAVQLAKTSKLYQRYDHLVLRKAGVNSKKIGITMGVISWADKVKNKQIPGLKASFKWKLKDMPEDYSQIFAGLMGSTATKAGPARIKNDNTQLVFQNGVGYLAGLDIRKIDALKEINHILKGITQKLPELLFSLLPMGMDDIGVSGLDHLKIIAGVDVGIDRLGLFKDVKIPADNFIFSDEIIEVIYRKSEVGKVPDVIGRVSSWMELKLGAKAKVKAYTVVAMPFTGPKGLTSMELAGFIDGTIHHPFGLIDKKRFPDLRLVNPEIGAELGFTGWSLWVGGKPEMGKGPDIPIEFLRVGVMPNPPFISFVEADMDKVGIQKAMGAISEGSIKSIGTDFNVGSLPINKFTIGGFEWKKFKTKGPRIIYSTMNIDVLNIQKGVTALGGLNLADSGKRLKLGQFEFMQQASGTVAGRGDVNKFKVGPLHFSGKDKKKNPMLDFYLTNGPSMENRILFSGALDIAGYKLNSLIKLKTTEDVEISSYGDLFDFGKIELSGKGSVLSLVDTHTGHHLSFEGEISDADMLKKIQNSVSHRAERISVVREALKLVGGTLFALESVTIKSSAGLLHDKKISEATLKGSSFGKNVTITVAGGFPHDQLSDKLASGAAHKIEETAKDLLPDPFKFLNDLKNEAKKLSEPVKNEFKNLAGKDPTRVLSGMSSAIDSHAQAAEHAARQAQKTAQESAHQAAQAAKKVAKALLDAAKKMWHHIKFW